MALFTDGTISSIEALAAHDTGILDLAGTEGINLASKLRLAQEALGVELITLLQRAGVRYSWTNLQSFPGLDNVVVTTPLSLWHAFHTLELVYRDAYNNQLNDRYLGKWKQFKELASWASEKLIQTGMGLVWQPIPQAAEPRLSYLPGTRAGATYYVRASWAGPNGAEGLASNVISIPVPDGNVLQVRTPTAPAGVKLWNVFVGLAPAAVSQQNETSLGLDEVWVQTGPVSLEGRQPGKGQEPDCVRPVPRILQRG